MHLKKKIEKENVNLIVGVGDYADTSVLRDIEFKFWKKLKTEKNFEKILGKERYLRLLKKIVKSQKIILNSLKKLNKPFFGIYGNSDYLNKDVKKYSLNGLESFFKTSLFCLLKTSKKRFKGIFIRGLSGYRGASSKGLINIDNVKKKKLKKFNEGWVKRLKRLFTNYNNKKFNVFVVHDVPYGYFDVIRYKKSPLYGKSIGDKYILRFIKKYQPSLVLCGHMHEYQGKKKIGKTILITTGSAADGKAVIIEIDEKKGKIKKIKFIQ